MFWGDIVIAEMCIVVRVSSARPILVILTLQRVTGDRVQQRKGRRAKGSTCQWSVSITYTVAFATRGTLGPGQTSVSLLSLLTRGSYQAHQPWMTL